MSDEHRTKIANSQILRRLIGHVEGTEDMTSTQVTAGIALLKKVLPDVASVEVTGNEDAPLAMKVVIGGDA